MTFAYTFPGQGSQSAGMGLSLYQAYPSARAVFEEVDDALGEHLSRVIFEGPEETLRLTANAQPALMAVSLAAMRALEAEGVGLDNALLVGGHSLGEYSALAAAGALTVADAARLLRLRGEAMQEAVPEGEGAMAALLGLDLETAESVAQAASEGEVCEVANDNAPGQCVVSGTRSAVERAISIARERGARRPVLLPVSAPFHCSLMAPAAAAMAAALESATINAPKAPLLANVSASRLIDPSSIKRSLIAQVTGRVRWRESVSQFANLGVRTVLEIGAGRVLTGLAKRIDSSLEAISINSASDVALIAQRGSAAA
ncbi:ACP S-malonyltransferase [Acuticoccus kandeliae]|uniref:ACP S-malonyltransferase n=1 Tax=Acuticoccus kandeliae TaxID=2073160 RepID=UPI000D3E16A6|nr:ACP S-malonyltransferase [Acuticoccus kandeliae]